MRLQVQVAAARAVAVIDEAIAIWPAEPYFREQRRRFLGERSADDRPDPPPPPHLRPREPVPLPPRDEPGITV